MSAAAPAEFIPVPVPAEADDADWPLFVRWVDAFNATNEAYTGSDLENSEPRGSLAAYASPYWVNELLLVVADGRDVGIGYIRAAKADGTRTAELQATVLPDLAGRGIGTALVDLLEARAAELGRTVLQGFTVHVGAPGDDALAAPTGFGVVPRDATTRFMLGRGYQLSQIERLSAFPLGEATDALVASNLVEATAASGADYRVVSWAGRTPEAYLADVGVLIQRLATDAPMGDLERTEEEWDEDRVRNRDDRLLAAGDLLLTACAQHVPSGRLVAFNNLVVSNEKATAPVQQGITLVLTEHRGHRLGMLVKTANIAAVREAAPERTAIITYNAEENRPMLDVNEALGFVPVNRFGAWQKETS